MNGCTLWRQVKKRTFHKYLNLPCYCSEYQSKLQGKSYIHGKEIVLCFRHGILANQIFKYTDYKTFQQSRKQDFLKNTMTQFFQGPLLVTISFRCFGRIKRNDDLANYLGISITFHHAAKLSPSN